MIRLQTAYPQGIIAERYLLREQIGQGRMSTVYLARDQAADEAPVAVRIFNANHPGEIRHEVFRRETAAHKRLNHPNIVGLHHRGILGDNEQFYLVMD